MFDENYDKWEDDDGRQDEWSSVTHWCPQCGAYTNNPATGKHKAGCPVLTVSPEQT